jgi:hypothetical protein
VWFVCTLLFGVYIKALLFIHSFEELKAWVGAEPISDVCRRNSLRWFKHVERKWDDDWVKRYTRLEVMVDQGKCG